jgi:hypothetical protein
MTGETVRRTLVASGAENYRIYMDDQGLWDGRWGCYRGAIKEVLPVYIDGEISLSEAARDLLKILAETDSSN